MSLADVERRAADAPAAVDARAALARGERVKIIAEVKRKSPSKGHLAEIPDPAALAQVYEEAGASAISVLTEGRRFGGSLRDLEAVRDRVAIPVLRKDFLVTPYQVLEARAHGADLALLIVAALDDRILAELHELALQLGMTPLVEAHTRDEVLRAADVGASVIGVNARDLGTFELDRDLFGRLVQHMPDDVIRVAESAVKGPGDVAHYREHGADVVLIGEALVTSDPRTTLTKFLAVTP